jgi:hypothetical protein
MSLAIVILFLGCLWFYFKEPGFRKATHIIGAVLGVLVVLGGLAAGAWYLKTQHDEKVNAAHERNAINANNCALDRDDLRKAIAAKQPPEEKGIPPWELKYKGNAGVEKDSKGNYMWYFEDGSEMPLDEFIERTTKDMQKACKNE